MTNSRTDHAHDAAVQCTGFAAEGWAIGGLPTPMGSVQDQVFRVGVDDDGAPVAHYEVVDT